MLVFVATAANSGIGACVKDIINHTEIGTNYVVLWKAFVLVFLTDVNGHSGEDQCVLQHSNR